MRKILCVTDDIASTDSQAGPHGGSKKQKSRQMLDVVLCTQQHDHNQSTNECIWRWLEIGAQRATLLYFCRHAHSSTFFFFVIHLHTTKKKSTQGLLVPGIILDCCTYSHASIPMIRGGI